MGDVKYEAPQHIVLILFFILLGLIVLLIFLYRKLNKDANGKYTVRRIVYREGGLRDRVRGAALALGARLGIQLWPDSERDEDEEEMQVQDEEREVEQGSSQRSDSEEDDQEEDENAQQCDKGKGKGDDTSEDDTCSEGSEPEEQPKITDQPEEQGETGEKVVEEESKGEASGGPGLLIDLKQFSGSAIWSEEEGGKGKDGDVTAL